MRPALGLLVVALTVAWTGVAPAGDPEVPETYMTVDQVKARLDLRQAVTFIDVRPREQYDALHIRGARNIPVDELQGRLADVSRQEFLVLY